MLQIIQYQKTGELSLVDLPDPVLNGEGIVIKTIFSLISSGTEKKSVETAQASLLGKAQARPDLLNQVKENIKREGLISTYHKVQTRLDNYKELGYSSAGIVVDSNTPEFRIGDRVACAGFAVHAEKAFIPKNLAAKVPDSVSLKEAAFTTLGSIALQGLRQTQVKLGETIVVVGLGLLGLITIQLLKANGCKVIGIDIVDKNFELALKLGCDQCYINDFNVIDKIMSVTKGHGSDSTIITATTKSNDPILHAIEFARKKSSIVIVGDVKMDFPRFGFYEKELEIKQSCSYGPGRYDKIYEEKGIDYPIGYVRWTENRNMQAILELLQQKKLDVNSLITHEIKINNGLEAYDIITGKKKEQYLALLFSYPNNDDLANNQNRRFSIQREQNNRKKESGRIGIGFIGAGNFAQSYLLPNIVKLDTTLVGVQTSRPVTGKSVADKFDFKFFTTHSDDIITAEEINVLFIATRHNSHAKYIIEGLTNGKHVFVEKPLAVNFEQLEAIKDSYSRAKTELLVGFNRRYASSVIKLKALFQNRTEPMVITYRINAGYLPRSHWYQDKENGGRIVGEVCHFVDTIGFLTDSVPESIFSECITSNNSAITEQDNVSIIIKYQDGSLGNIIYLSNGDTAYPKEHIDIYCDNSIARLDNFKKLEFYKNKKRISFSFNGEKGHKEEISTFIECIKGNLSAPITFSSLYSTTYITLLINESLTKKVPVNYEL